MKKTMPKLMVGLCLLILGAMMSTAFVASILETTVFAYEFFGLFLRTLLFVGIFTAISSSRISIWISLGLFALASGLLLLGFFTEAADPPRTIHLMADTLRDMVMFISGNGVYQPVYGQIVVWGLCAVFALCMVAFSRIKWGIYPLLVLSVAIYGVLLNLAVFTSMNLFILFAVCLLLYILYYFARGTDGQSGFRSILLPLAAICLLLGAVIPMPAPGFLQDNAIVQPIRQWADTLTAFGRSDQFSLRQTGFGGQGGRLGGNVTATDNPALRIWTDARAPLYLTGAIFTDYTGYAWVRSPGNRTFVDFGRTDQHLGLLERASTELSLRALGYGFLEEIRTVQVWDEESGLSVEVDWFDEETLTEYGIFFETTMDFLPQFDIPTVRTMTVDTLQMNSQTLFTYGAVLDITAPGHRIAKDEHGQLSTETRMGAGEVYRVSYLDIETTMGTEHEPFSAVSHPILSYTHRGFWAQMLQNVPQGVRFSGVVVQLSDEPGDNLILPFHTLIQDHLIEEAARIYETYTILPDDFPARVTDHARTVTQNAENDFQRASMLENYLRTSFAYTLSPGMPPRDRDFVEHFLFYGQEGYCTYFATAFVTMARSLGLPARYVEGFLVRGAPEADGAYHVTSGMAHAWAEVYFEGFGWLRFEPTAPDPLMEGFNTPDTPPAGANTPPPPPPPSPTPPPEANQTPQENPTQPPPTNVPEPDDEQNGSAVWLIILSGILLCGGAVGYVLLRRNKRKKAQTMMTDKDWVVSAFYRTERILRRQKCVRNPAETARQFAARADDLLGDEERPMTELAGLFDKACYGPGEIDENERFRAERLARRVEEVVGEKRGK